MGRAFGGVLVLLTRRWELLVTGGLNSGTFVSCGNTEDSLRLLQQIKNQSCSQSSEIQSAPGITRTQHRLGAASSFRASGVSVNLSSE